jgi:hypothetical protein
MAKTGGGASKKVKRGCEKNGEKAGDAFASEGFARGVTGRNLLLRVRHNGTMRATDGY